MASDRIELLRTFEATAREHGWSMETNHRDGDDVEGHSYDLYLWITPEEESDRGE